MLFFASEKFITFFTTMNIRFAIPLSVWRPVARQFHTGRVLANSLKLNLVPIQRTRNIGIIAHIDAGKTTTTERMLFYSGKTSRIGNVDEGDTVTDYLPSERQRGITIQLAAITIPWNNNKINIIDTPGHADFTFEVIRSLRVLDGAVTILDGVAGVEAQTEKVWKQASELGIPKIAYVNKMDRDGAGFSRTVKEIIEKLQTRVVLCTIPYFETGPNGSPQFLGVLDVLQKKLLKWDPEADATGRVISVVDIEQKFEEYPEQYDMINSARESMVETLGEFDDSIVESFFEHDEDYMKVPAQVLNAVIHKATVERCAVPVFCGSSFRNIGVQPLLDGIVNYLPSPLQIPLPEISSNKRIGKVKKKSGEKKQEVLVPIEMNPQRGLVINKNPNLTVALAFKVITHATRGVMTFFRVYSGKLTSNTTVINTRTGKKLSFRKLLLIHGDEPENVTSIASGNIGVICGMEDELMTGDTIVSHGHLASKSFSEMESNLKMLPIEIPPPLFNSSIEPLTAGDSRHMNACIKILEREDPSIAVTVDEDLGQTIISGMGELHLEILRERLVKDMKANVRLRDVAVSYKETLAKPQNKTVEMTASDNEYVSVSIQLDSFEGPAESSDYADEDGAVITGENNIIILEPTATPDEMHKAVKERRWKCEHSLEDLQQTVVQGCATALQIGGPIFGLPLHSMVVRIKKWTFPFDDKAASPSLLLDISRRVISNHIRNVYNQDANLFTVLEPMMVTKVYVGSDVLGEVVNDLTQRCQAVITSIDDAADDDLDAASWAADQAERTYLPPDYTMRTGSAHVNDIKNSKIVIAETPLREMIGYLSKLRSITQGRGTFDMTFAGMRRTMKSRMATIANEFTV